MMNQQQMVQDNLVVSMEYTLSVDGEIVASADSNDPIQFIQGMGNIIPGLEREINGMTIGESKNITLTPEDGYGEYDDEAFAEVPRDEIPDNVPLEIGTAIEMEDEEGNYLEAVIDEIADDYVVLDFNHPLAGQELHFAIKVIALRDATEEELEHQHVHFEGHEH
ncbi:MAG: peptidylprolyl isomerase [Chloroflexi bacterium]|jgi:FKBP-type peptidyl-prolyl cis-trans isomerase SlyD|nr:peptidylprolyl isomerase [Chloroflexota bacterium]